jgi:iron complex outermembrane receptor protein
MLPQGHDAAPCHIFHVSGRISAGFDVNRASFRHTNNSPYSGSSTVDPYTFDRGTFINVAGTAPKYNNEAVQYAFFAEDRIEITPRWSVLAGLRYDHADIRRHDLVSGQQAYDKSFSNVGWRAGTVYSLTDDLAVYAQYSEAADPVSALLMLSPANSNFSLATGHQVEAGVKQNFLANKGEWTLAAYRIVKKNLVTRDVSNPSLSVQVGEQSTKGLEATVGVEFLPGWRVKRAREKAASASTIKPAPGSAALHHGSFTRSVRKQTVGRRLSRSGGDGARTSGG